MTKNFSFRSRLVASFGALALMVLIVAGISLRSLTETNGHFIGFVEGINLRATLADDVRTAVDRRAIAARNLVLVVRPEDIAIEKAAVLQAHGIVKPAAASPYGAGVIVRAPASRLAAL